jgi:hypothetical protein
MSNCMSEDLRLFRGELASVMHDATIGQCVRVASDRGFFESGLEPTAPLKNAFETGIYFDLGN